MNKIAKKWIGIAIINLSIVALIGFVLRSKIIFSIPIVDYKNTLHAHSHFAFSGWVTLALLSLMTYEILPKSIYQKPVYKWLLVGVLFCAIGMLCSFPFQGYGLISITFSTLLIFVTYIFSYLFIKDVLKTDNSRSIKLLAIAALIYLVLSSIGPFTLSYVLISRSSNVLLYRDSIYTYLHLQYNGFFTLAIIALLFNQLKGKVANESEQKMYRFSHILNATVIPSMFLSYLWHYPNATFRIIAITGSILLVLCIVYFFIVAYSLKAELSKIGTVVRNIGFAALSAFILKMTMQSLTISSTLGALVFVNRPMIIGFLHLVLLGFVTLYLITHILHSGYLKQNKQTTIAVYVFASAVIANEAILIMQGLGVMLMTSSDIYAYLLWGAAIGLLLGAIMLVYGYYSPNKGELT